MEQLDELGSDGGTKLLERVRDRLDVWEELIEDRIFDAVGGGGKRIPGKLAKHLLDWKGRHNVKDELDLLRAAEIGENELIRLAEYC